MEYYFGTFIMRNVRPSFKIHISNVEGVWDLLTCSLHDWFSWIKTNLKGHYLQKGIKF